MQYNNLPEGLSYIEISTLIDISTTGTFGKFKQADKTDFVGSNISQETDWKRSRNKQRNWETIIQIIGLRAQPLYLDNSAMLTNQDLSNFNFGESYTGTHTVWTCLFGVEAQHVYDTDIELDSLIQDFNGVPITINLSETIQLPKPIFCTTGECKNIYFRPIIPHTNI